MECPRCHKKISDNETVCPHCKKVFALECPNCHSLNQTSKCEKCGYIILTKCAKCGKTVSTTQEKCKCGFPVLSSIAYQECETDEFANVIIRFSSLRKIRRILGSQELFTKFYYKLKNLLTAQFKNLDGNIIIFNDIFCVNFNKELSFATSVNKATRFALKLVNSFVSLNTKVEQELGTNLGLNITISKQTAEELLKHPEEENNVKLLNIKKQQKKYLKGIQIILDQYAWDIINKEYKTDSLYSIEADGRSTMFYEILLDSYIVPPSDSSSETPIEVIPKEIKKTNSNIENNDLYSFKVFDINAKCKFYKTNALELIEKLDDNKIISIRANQELMISTETLTKYYLNKNQKIILISCTEEMNYRPWGFFEQIFRDYYKLSAINSLLPNDFEVKNMKPLFELLKSTPLKASTPEDARFAYMEYFGSFLNLLKNYTIIIEGFEHLDDTSIQTLELYFDKFRKIVPNFIFLTNSEEALHSKFKGLLRTPLYSEYILKEISADTIISSIKEEAGDFIQSFYYEKIKDNFEGSYLYFDNAIKYLKEKDILISFEGRLLIKNNKSIIVPANLVELIKARLKNLSKHQNASLILAYSYYLGARIDFETLNLLGVKDIESSVNILCKMGFINRKDNIIYINDYNLVKQALEISLKKEIEEFLCKNILAKLKKGLEDTKIIILMGKLGLFKEEYLLLWKNSQFAMKVGDYDAYLKNCLGFLSLIEHIENNIPKEDIKNNKKEVYENILISLYNYSPEKIYSIENVLLIDAIEIGDNDKIAKLSNLMLQGALISSNYTDALTLLHNILTRMSNPTLLVDGVINTKFLLLSLVNIEILFNIGDFAQCVEVAKDILAVLQPEIIEKVRPANFSVNLFIEHLSETFRLASFAKLILTDNDIEEFFEMIKSALGEDLADKNCIIAIRDYLNGKEFAPSNIENASAFSKVIYLILQEFSEHKDDYKTFAQNIYQAKLLASDLHQKQLELFCDLLIAYSYANIGIEQKALAIYNDIIGLAEKSSIFNILILAKYFIAKLKNSNSQKEEALLIINDTLALLQKYNNQAKIFYVLFEKLFIDIVKAEEISSINIESEEQKLLIETTDGKLARLMN